MDTSSSVETMEIPVQIKELNLTMRNQIFDGVNPTGRFAFLTRFVNKADTLRMSKAQAFRGPTDVVSGPGRDTISNQPQ